MKKILTSLLIATLLTCPITGCSKKAPSDAGNNVSKTTEADAGTTSGQNKTETAAKAEPSGELITLRVSTLAQQLSIPMYYIQKMGWDVENGFKLDISTFMQGSGINEALGSGLVDVFTIGAAGISSCSVYDAVYLFSHTDSGAGQQFMIRADSDVAATKGYNPEYPDIYGTPETVAGKSFLLPMGTAAQILVDMYLNVLGLTEDDVTLVNMDDTAAYQAFVSGQSDFAKTSYPTADSYDPEQYLVACSMNNLNCPYYDNILCSREAFENESKREALVALSVQLLRAAEAFQDDKVLMDTMMEWYEINGQTADGDSIEHQVLERPFFTYDDLTSIDYTSSFKLLAEFYATVGNISEEDMEKVYANMDNTIIAEALEIYAAEYKK